MNTGVKGFTKEKTERNKLIIKELLKGKSFQQVALMFGLRAKMTVHQIYTRALKNKKYGVRKLSTRKFAKQLPRSVRNNILNR